MATARGTLTLIQGHAATATPKKAAPTLVPVIDPARDAALEAALEPDVIIAMDDAIGRALDHMHNNRGTSVGAILSEVWRAAFATGYLTACDRSIEAGIADAMAELATVTELHPWTGGEPA